MATQEFAEYGIAGARIERIVNVVPIDADDLADWAVRLYDEYLRRPDLIRPATWARLERRPAGRLVDDHDRLDDGKLRAIAEAQAAGRVREGDPFDVMAMIIAMSMAWLPVSNVYAATAQEPSELHERRRALLRESVRRAMSTG
nr:TetR/AcrR family transcriptional regulator [Streptomyces griseicoloratus]